MPHLFVALALPIDVRTRITQLCAGVPGARWAGIDHLHVTLRFIGEVDGTAADDVAETLDGIGGQPFDLALKGVGNFEKGRTPTLLWVGIADKAPLLRLHEKIDRRLGLIGHAPETRKYHPHVTLARLKGAHRERVGAFLAQYGDFAAGPVAVDSFHLYSSHRGDDGAIYRIERSYALDDA